MVDRCLQMVCGMEYIYIYIYIYINAEREGERERERERRLLWDGYTEKSYVGPLRSQVHGRNSTQRTSL